MKGGVRQGAGRKKQLPSEQRATLSVKLCPGLREPLEQWKSLGFDSQSDAIRHAIDLWAAMNDAGLWNNQAECFDLISHPVQRFQQFLKTI